MIWKSRKRTPPEPGSHREVLEVAWPLIVSTGSFTVMTFCDRVFLAWYSAVAIQAALPAGILAFTLASGFMALASYASTFVAQYYGAGDLEGCSRATAQGVWLALLSWPVLLLLIPAGRGLLSASGHPADVIEAERSYFTILMWGSFASPLGAAVSGFWTGRGQTRVTMAANVIANVVNILLDYTMIFGRWGFPEMGLAGAAWATVIAGFISPAILLAFYFAPRVDAQFRTRRTFRYDARLFWRMIRFGLPSGIHLALDIASFTIFVLLTGRLGRVALAASNIALSINTLAFMPLIGLGIAASILVGQYQGRGDSSRAEKSGWAAARIGVGYMALIGATFVLFPRAYISLFADRGAQTLSLAEIFPVARRLLIILAAWGVFDAVGIVLSSALKGAGDTRFVMYYSTALAWGFLVTGQIVLIELLHVGIVASWVWTAIYIALLAVGDVCRYVWGRWKTIDVLGREVPIEPARPGADALVATE